MQVIDLIKKLKSCSVADLAKVNYMQLPVNLVYIEEYNELVRWCSSNPLLKRGISRTPSGGISISPRSPINCWESTPRRTKRDNCTGCELIILILDYDMKTKSLFHFGARIQIGKYKGDEAEKHMCGRRAYLKFRELLLKRNIKIEDQFLKNYKEGLEYKSKIEKPMISLAFGTKENETYLHAYHYDINSSYASGMKEAVPQWSELIDYLYINRHFKRENKDILNMTIGFFQSEYIDYKLSHISQYCIKRNNDKLSNKAVELIRKGCHILAFNTDGLWFTKPNELELQESKELGEFKLDHKDCKIRFKSAGVYEFEENGKYTPVVRGTTALDRIKLREEWVWGDIYCEGAKPLIFNYNEDGTISEQTLEDKCEEIEKEYEK